MSKQRKKQLDDAQEVVETTNESVTSEATENTAEAEGLQAVENGENVAKNGVEPTANEKPAKQKSGGTAIALLALLVALGIGGAGYFFGSQKLSDVETQIANLNSKAAQLSSAQNSANSAVEMPNFDAEKAQIATLTEQGQKAVGRLDLLEREQGNYTAKINELQLEIQKLNSAGTDNAAWVLSDANSLLQTALRKLSVDSDIQTAKALLSDANAMLAKLNNPMANTVRQGIMADLADLNQVNDVDQNAIMLYLTTLANRLDDLPILTENGNADEGLSSGEVSDSLEDWQENLEKSASSFLDHFIRVSDRNKGDEKAFVAPNQEIYLRENIRLRLQIATLAVPRQQNELYKQSLATVESWIRSYFDTENDNVKDFLRNLGVLREQSIYVDAPKVLKSLEVLNQLLNRPVATPAPTPAVVPTAEQSQATAPQAAQ